MHEELTWTGTNSTSADGWLFWAFLPFFFSRRLKIGLARRLRSLISLLLFLSCCNAIIPILDLTVNCLHPSYHPPSSLYTLVYSPFLLVSLFLDRVPRFCTFVSFPSSPPPTPFSLSFPPRSLPPCVSFEIACMGGYS